MFVIANSGKSEQRKYSNIFIGRRLSNFVPMLNLDHNAIPNLQTYSIIFIYFSLMSFYVYTVITS